eukprot:jgi/Ulvmu1/3815/UM018_0026.1
MYIMHGCARSQHRRTQYLQIYHVVGAHRSRAPPSYPRTTSQQAQRWQGTAKWYVAEAQKPAFLAVEFALGLGFLALIDGGFSGDWLKYQLIDESTQQLLSNLASVGVLVHSGIGVACARQAIRRQPDAALPAATIAFLRGFLCGSPELLLVLARNNVKSVDD